MYCAMSPIGHSDEQLGARLRRIGRTADHRDDLVEVGHGDDQAEQDMRAFAGLVQFELRPPRDDLFAEAMKAWMKSRSVRTSGRPPRIASMLAGKLACAGV